MKNKWTITFEVEVVSNSDNISIQQDVIEMSPVQRLGLLELLKQSILREAERCQK